MPHKKVSEPPSRIWIRKLTPTEVEKVDEAKSMYSSNTIEASDSSS